MMPRRFLVFLLMLVLALPYVQPANADLLIPVLLELIPADWVWSDFTTGWFQPASATDDPPGAATMTEYTIPPGTSFPHGVAKEEGLVAATQGGSPNVWFTTLSGSSVVKLDPQTGAETQYVIPVSAEIVDVRTTPNGKVWFDTSDGQLGRLDPTTNVVTLYMLPGIGFLDWIHVDQFGNVWAAELSGSHIVVLNPDTGVAYSYAVGMSNAGLVRRRSGDVWWCQRGDGQIGRLDLRASTVTHYTTSFSAIEGCGLDPIGDPDGLVWVTPGFAGTPSDGIGVLDPKSLTFTLYTTPTPSSAPYGVSIGCAGSVAFGEDAASQVGLLVPRLSTPTSVTSSSATTGPAAATLITPLVTTSPVMPVSFVAMMNSGSVSAPTINGFREYPTLTPAGEGPHLDVIGPNEKIVFSEIFSATFGPGKIGILELPPGARCNKQ